MNFQDLVPVSLDHLPLKNGVEGIVDTVLHFFPLCGVMYFTPTLLKNEMKQMSQSWLSVLLAY